MKKQRAPPKRKMQQETRKGRGGTTVEIQGKFDAQRFFDALALILSEREGVKITVRVTQDETEEVEAAGHKTATA